MSDFEEYGRRRLPADRFASLTGLTPGTELEDGSLEEVRMLGSELLATGSGAPK